MPIYAYRCDACGFAKDVLQKMSDPQLTECPSCAQSTFKKQVTAAGFQLKGSGWYVTDFRNGPSGKAGGATSAPGGAVAAAPDSAAPAGTDSAAQASPAGATGASAGASDKTSSPTS